MSAQTLNPDELAAAARVTLERAVETKVGAVRELVERAGAAEHAEQRAADARAGFEAAWSAALSTGWTDKELRHLGLSSPGQPRTRTPRKRRTPDAPSGPAEA